MPQLFATLVGGHGFIGTALLRYLTAQGWACQVAERDTSWPITNRPLGHVFYCAGLTADYLLRAADTVEAHVCLLARVLQSSQWESLVYLSSTRLYDGLPWNACASEDSLLPISSQVPRHLYDLTKLTGESLCHVLGAGRARVARLASVYDGPDGNAGFLPALLQQVTEAPRGATLPVDSSILGERDYVHLPDVLRAVADIATRGTQAVYNVASGENVSNAQLAQWVEQFAGRRMEFLRSDAQVAVPPRVDMRRLHDEFGWRPAPLELVITRLLRQLA